MNKNFQNFVEIKCAILRTVRLILIASFLFFFFIIIFFTPIYFFPLILIPSALFLFPTFFGGSSRVKSVISEKKIEFYIRDRLYFEIKWDEIESIRIYEEKYYYPGRLFRQTSFVLEFKGININKTIRLICFPFTKKKSKLIVQSIIEYTKNLKRLKIIELPLNEEIKNRYKVCEEIINFRQRKNEEFKFKYK